MDALIDQVKHLASTADESGRRQLKQALQEAHNSLETTQDILTKMIGLPIQLSLTFIGVDRGLFKALANDQNPVKVDTLAQTCGFASELLGRILRYLASIGIVKETGLDEFTTNVVTESLCSPEGEAAIRLGFDSFTPVFQELPGFLAETKYQDLTDSNKTPSQKAFKTELPAYVWLSTDLERFSCMYQVMRAHRPEDWLSLFPLEQEVDNWSAEPEKALFVDMGGGSGHQCVRLKAKYPNLPGRIILQEIPETISLVKPTEGIEAMVHNLFDPQPIKGAKFYYLRNIIHDYPDDLCIKILQNIIPALDKESRILLDDMVLSNTVVDWRSTMADMSMMAMLAARERTRDQWYALLDRAGLKILDIHTYSPAVELSVVVAVPK